MYDLESEIEEFQDKEYREAYADEFLNTYVASQIRVIREERGMTQKQLAEAIGTHQAGISRIENVSYSGWSINTLKKLAHAFDCRLYISFETYASLFTSKANFKREALRRLGFKDDPMFKRRRDTRKKVVQLFPAPTRPRGKEGFEGIFNTATEQSRENTVKAAWQQLALLNFTAGVSQGRLDKVCSMGQPGAAKPILAENIQSEGDSLLNKRYGIAR